MGSNVPKDLKYSKDHEWTKVEGRVATVGITAFAVEQLGDIVFVDLPKKGAQLKAGGTFGVVESTKAVSDLYSPLTGTVVEINAALADAPESLNQDAYGNWLVKVEFSDAKELDALLDAAQYEEHIKTAGH